MQDSNSFSKSERLISKLVIDELFSSKGGIRVYPLKIIYIPFSKEEIRTDSPQILISAPKRKFKRAVDRNLIKRRIKEAYRLNKPALHQKNIKAIGIIYVSNQIETFKIIQDKLNLGFSRLLKDH